MAIVMLESTIAACDQAKLNDLAVLIKDNSCCPKFELDATLCTEVMYSAGIDALEQGLLPVPSSLFYVECVVDQSKGQIGSVVRYDSFSREISILCVYRHKKIDQVIEKSRVQSVLGKFAGVYWVHLLASVDGGNITGCYEDGELTGLIGTTEKNNDDVLKLGTIIGLSCCMALACKDIEAVRVGPSDRVVRKREAKGLPPLDEYRRLTVKPYARAAYEAAAAEGSRNGPRFHFRRGHVRNLHSGVKTYVSPCWVGNANLGTITKDYVVKA